MATTKAKLASALTLVSIVLGFMVAVQYKESQSHSQLTQTYSLTDAKLKQLDDRLKTLQSVGQNEQKELAQARAQLSAYEKQAAGSDASLQMLQAQVTEDRILAGTTEVKGPGISITVTDGTPPAGASAQTIDEYVTHDWYMRDLINELFAAGAEAVDINNVRIVATSGIFCGGPVLWVNNNRIAAPFTVRAIGDAKYLKSALLMPGGEVERLRTLDNLTVSPIETEQSITMAAYTGTTTTSPAGSGS